MKINPHKADPRKLIHFKTHVLARVDLLTVATNTLSLYATIDMLTTTRAPVHHMNSYVLMALFKYLRPVSSDSQNSFVVSQLHKMVCLIPDKYTSINRVASQSCYVVNLKCDVKAQILLPVILEKIN